MPAETKRTWQPQVPRWSTRATGKVALVAGILFLCALPAVFVKGIIGYLPALTAAACIALSYIYLRIAARFIESAESSDARGCPRGSELDFTVTVRNRSILMLPRVDLFFCVSDVSGDVGTATEQAVTLGPRGERTFDLGISFAHIGRYSVGLEKVVLHDFLGLFTRTMKNTARYEIDVEPRIFDIERIEVDKQGIAEYGMYSPLAINDAMDYSGVRSYEQGDPMKMVHWKLSARSEEYYTRTYESYSNPGIAAVVDFSAPRYELEDTMSIYDGVVESAFSIEQYAVKSGLESELIFDSKDGVRRKYVNASLRESFEVVAEMPKVSHDVSQDIVLSILEDERNSLYSQNNIAVCTANVTEELVASLLAMRRRKKNPMLIAVLPPGLNAEQRTETLRPLERLMLAQITYYAISAADDLAQAV